VEYPDRRVPQGTRRFLLGDRSLRVDAERRRRSGDDDACDQWFANPERLSKAAHFSRKPILQPRKALAFVIA